MTSAGCDRDAIDYCDHFPHSKHHAAAASASARRPGVAAEIPAAVGAVEGLRPARGVGAE